MIGDHSRSDDYVCEVKFSVTFMMWLTELEKFTYMCRVMRKSVSCSLLGRREWENQIDLLIGLFRITIISRMIESIKQCLIVRRSRCYPHKITLTTYNGSFWRLPSTSETVIICSFQPVFFKVSTVHTHEIVKIICIALENCTKCWYTFTYS